MTSVWMELPYSMLPLRLFDVLWASQVAGRVRGRGGPGAGLLGGNLKAV